MRKLAIYEQLVLAIKAEIAAGILHAGDKLPSVRKFALENNINPNTAVKVYKTLENEGVINSIPSKGNFISDDIDTLQAVHVADLTAQFTELIREMRDNCVTKETLLEIIEGVYHDFES
ncbi:GntR family transcriptional regulator [Lactococcus hodotermopsidis]|uniref:GntR family transcriptional regulator n=1 Tax=Pseudolactococcus hodotermopsidis TaxID=2709157 RepID=A0A6A0BBY8_9LACT|nr:GntR family transcriptional regulator [Lactococcus hodotermopsidis]GFH42910.1 GntR family transcriptional regulator [Lactococcus hodotermopsidis]